MKKLCAIVLVFLPCMASAVEVTPVPLVPGNVQIIEGKKFFSLQNVRRQPSTSSSTGNEVLSPQALSVMNHPRTDPRLPVSERMAMTPVTSNPARRVRGTPQLPMTQPSGSGASIAEVSKSDQIKNDLLSIFAPDGSASRGSLTLPKP